MNYCFSGLNPGAMTTYAAGVARALHVRDPEAQFSFIVDDPSGLEGVEFPPNSRFLDRGAPHLRQVRSLLAEASPDALITTAQRIPDSVFVSAARERGAFTCMLQHGLYLPFMKREPSLFLRKAVKTAHYLWYARTLAKLHGRPPLRYVGELFRVFVLGSPYAAARVDHGKLNVDLVLLNGEYWRGFHTRQFGYPPESQVVVGYPDYDQLAEIEAQPVRGAVCYVAQTLVEHGRLDAAVLKGFLSTLATATRDRQLLVKLHPASDLRLYDDLRDRPGVEFMRDQLPRATHYVGHYSTYLALVPFLSRNLLLWEFEGHPTPESLRPAASVVTSDPGALERFVRSPGPHEPAAHGVEQWNQYFHRGEQTAFEKAADQIVSRLTHS